MIGAHLACALLKRGYDVRATITEYDDINKTKRIFSYYSDDYLNLFNEIKWFETPLDDYTALVEAATGANIVYFCCDIFLNQKFKPENQLEYIKNIISVLKETKTEYFYYVNTLDSLGEEPEFKEINEKSQRNPKGNYPKMSRLNFQCEMEVWKALNEELKGCILNTGIVLGPGDWRYDSSRIFSLANSYGYYTKGVTGFVGIYDVIKCLMTLSRKKISGEKFILVAENLSYFQVMKMIAENFNTVKKLKYAGKYRMALYKSCYFVKSLLIGRRPILDKNYFNKLTTFKLYSNAKSIGSLIIDYEDISEVVNKVCDIYTKDNTPEIKKFYKFT